MFSWASPWIEGFWHSALAAIPMAVLVAVVSAVFRLRPATRHALWCMVLLMLIARPFLPTAPPMLSLERWAEIESTRTESGTPILLAQAPDSVGLFSIQPPDGGESLSYEAFHPKDEQKPPFDTQPPRNEVVVFGPETVSAAGPRSTPVKAPRPGAPFQGPSNKTAHEPIVEKTGLRSAEIWESNPRAQSGNGRKRPASRAPARRSPVGPSPDSDLVHSKPFDLSASRAAVQKIPRPKGLANTTVGDAQPSVEHEAVEEAAVAEQASPDAVKSDADEPAPWRAWFASGLRIRDAVMALPALPREIWFCGIAGFVMLAGARVIHFRRRLVGSTSAPRDVDRRVRRGARLLGLSRVPEVRMLNARVSPMIWCGRRSRLLLPTELWNQLDESSRDAVILHELAHLKRRDHWVRWVEIVVACVYWWHPVVFWIRRRLEEEADASCDAWVTWLEPRSRGAYARALLATQQFTSEQDARVPAVGIGMLNGRARRFARRLTMVMTQNGRPGLSLPGVGLMFALAAAGWLSAPARSCEPESKKVKIKQAAAAAPCDAADCKHCNGSCQCAKKKGGCCEGHKESAAVTAAPCSPAGVTVAPSLFTPVPPAPEAPCAPPAPRAAVGAAAVSPVPPGAFFGSPMLPGTPAPPGQRMPSTRAPRAGGAAPLPSGSTFEEHMMRRERPVGMAVMAPIPHAEDLAREKQEKEVAAKVRKDQKVKIRTEVKPEIAYTLDAQRFSEETAARSRELAAQAQQWAEKVRVDSAEIQKKVRQEVEEAIRQGKVPAEWQGYIRAEAEGGRLQAELRMKQLEVQLDQLRAQLDQLGESIRSHPGAAAQPRAPREPRPPRETRPPRAPRPPAPRFEAGSGPEGDGGGIIVRKYELPEGKLKELTELMIRSDVPVRVRPVEGGLEVHGTRPQHRIMRAFLEMIHPEGSRSDAGDLSAIEEALARVDFGAGFDLNFTIDVEPEIELDIDPAIEFEIDFDADDADEDVDWEADDDDADDDDSDDEHRGDAGSVWAQLAIQLVENMPVLADCLQQAGAGDLRGALERITESFHDDGADAEADAAMESEETRRARDAAVRAVEEQIRWIESNIRSLESHVQTHERETERLEREIERLNERRLEQDGKLDDAARAELEQRSEDLRIRSDELRSRIDELTSEIEEMEGEADALREEAEALREEGSSSGCGEAKKI